MPSILSRWLPDVRVGEKARLAAAFLTLFGMVAAVVLLETSRDALFLAHLPASRLPFVYLAMAAIALPLSRLHMSTTRAALAVVIAASAVMTAGMWFVAGHDSKFWLYAVYVWTGVYATLSVTRFWVVLSAHYTVAQAKRLYGFIGAGSVAGSIAGSLLARLTADFHAARSIILVAVIMQLLSLTASFWLPRPAVPSEEEEKEAKEKERGEEAPASSSFAEDLRVVLQHPYLSRVAALVLFSAATLTVLDYVFKSAVAEHVKAANLASFFATVQLVLNGLSLVCQVALVGWLSRKAGVVRMMCVLPAVIVLFAAGVAASVGLAMALALKAADGAFRYSLHRTAVELLFVPVADKLRATAKSFIDVAGQRVGQAVASLGILGIVAFGGGARVLAVVLMALAAGWLVIGLRFRAPYVELFREAMREGTIDSGAGLPDLDRAALQSLAAALDSPRDGEVLAALDLLAAQRHGRLVPSRILSHGSPAVLLRALQLLAAARRKDIVAQCDALLAHEDHEVRAAALRARMAVAPDVALLRARLGDESRRVSATARVGLARLAGADPEEILRPALASPDAKARRALAMAIGHQPAPAFVPALLALGRDKDVEVRLEAARAMAVVSSDRYLPLLFDMLPVRRLQSAAREAIRAMGRDVLPALDRAMRDPEVPYRIRRALPGSVGMFPIAPAGRILLHRLLDEPRGLIRFQVLRTLGRMRRTRPALPLDESFLDEAIRRTVASTYRMIHWRVSLEAEPLHTPLYELLIATLRDKQRHATERLFRMLGLRFPGEAFEPIYVGLHGDDEHRQAGAVELLHNLLEPPLREAVIGIVDDCSDEQCLEKSLPYYEHEPLTRAQALAAILDQGGETLCALAAYEAASLGLTDLRGRLEAMAARGGLLGEAVQNALAALDRPRGMEVAFAG